MTNAQHLIENAIYGLTKGRTVKESMMDYGNQIMLRETGITETEVEEIVDRKSVV